MPLSPDTKAYRPGPKHHFESLRLHKSANVLAALPKSAHPGARKALAEIWGAEDKQHALAAVRALDVAYGARFLKAVAAARRPPSPADPATQRASDTSLLHRLEVASERNRTFTEPAAPPPGQPGFHGSCRDPQSGGDLSFTEAFPGTQDQHDAPGDRQTRKGIIDVH